MSKRKKAMFWVLSVLGLSMHQILRGMKNPHRFKLNKNLCSYLARGGRWSQLKLKKKKSKIFGRGKPVPTPIEVKHLQ